MNHQSVASPSIPRSVPALKLGFIGSGTITSAIVTGLSATHDSGPIVLSPRNATISANLASQFKQVRVAPTNQAVLDDCDVVMLAVRPQIAAEVLGALRFRPDHHVVSLMATLSLQRVGALTAPATLITRAVPLPAVARRQGPTAIFPATPSIVALFNFLGTAIELGNENEFDTFSATTAIMASYFGFANTVATWMTQRGIASDRARRFIGEVLRGLAGTAAAVPDRSFAMLADEHQTAGGLNEQVLRTLTHAGVFTELTHALDAVLKRNQEASRATDRIHEPKTG